MRTYADPVDVRTGTGESADAPAAFLWRGRLYVVRDVLGHWRERQSWWASSAARLVHGEGGSARAVQSDPAAGRPAAGLAVHVAELAQEREVWRVCASRGRSYSEGVFDLCREPDAGSSDGSPTGSDVGSPTGSDVGSPGGVWRLVHVAD